MSSVHGYFQGRHRTRSQHKQADKTSFPIKPHTHGDQICHGLRKIGEEPVKFAFEHAQALKAAVTFAGSRFATPNHVKLEARFIDELATETDPNIKSGIVEMLGRINSVRAIPALSSLLDEKESSQVRMAVIQALGSIGGSTHANSFTRSQLTELLKAQFEHCKKELLNKKSSRLSPLAILMGMSDSSEDTHAQSLQELNTLCAALGNLQTDTGKQVVLKAFNKALDAAENNYYRAQDIQRAIRQSEASFIQTLEEKFNKPFEEIRHEVDPAELSAMRANLQVELPDGQTLSMKEARSLIQTLQKEYRLANEMLVGLANGVAIANDKPGNAALKLALDSSNSDIRAKALSVLGERNLLSYTRDIYPNLRSQHTTVRRAALSALVSSHESPAKQKMMELLEPMAFLDIYSDESTRLPEAVAAFNSFVTMIVQDGDNSVEAVRKAALDKNFSPEIRQVAIMILQAMTQSPFQEGLLSNTTREAKQTVRKMALKPTGSDPEERRSIQIIATTAWISLKETQAVKQALAMLKDPIVSMSPDEQMMMLDSLYTALKQDYDAARRTRQQQALRQTWILSLLQKKGKYTPEAIRSAQQSLQPLASTIITNPTTMEEKFINQQDEPQDSEFVQQIRGEIKQIRPLIGWLLENGSSPETRMLAARLAGILEDQGSVDQLLNLLKDPLKGLINWQRARSYPGRPAIDGANIRINAMIALGEIGHPKAVQTVASALDDNTLRRFATEPLKQLAQSANQTCSDKELASVRERLMRVVNNPDTSRLSRAIRISAANALFDYKGGVDTLKEFITTSSNPDFKRHVTSALISNNYALEPDHPDHSLVQDLLYPGLGVEQLHAQGITGKGVELAIIDGGYVDKGQTEGFQNRVQLPPEGNYPEHEHPTMVMTTAAGNGKLKGVAPDVLVYSDKWPELGGDNPMEVYKKIIEGKLRGENNIQVINNSWGFTDNNVVIFKDVRNILKEFKSVVELAEKAGIQIVFSAGNSGEDPGIPSLGNLGLFGLDVDKLTAEENEELDYILDKVILVGASNTQGGKDIQNHRLANFSSVGDNLNSKLRPTVVAPGVDMMVYSWNEGKRGKALVNGTSFSGPYVSGLLALMYQANPQMSPAQARSILKSTAVKLPGLPDALQGYGQVNPLEAVNKAQQSITRNINPVGIQKPDSALIQTAAFK